MSSFSVRPKIAFLRADAAAAAMDAEVAPGEAVFPLTDQGASELSRPVLWTSELRLSVEQWAGEAGFDAAGIAAVGDPEDADESADRERFREWIEAGHAGEMAYLERRDASGSLVRGDLRISQPWARSVVVCALSYNASGPRSIDPAPAGSGWIARYAWSGSRREDGTLGPTDYHDELLGRLRSIEGKLLAEAPGVLTRAYVDTGPILERSAAARAGVGWIGRNTCVLNQELGSWLLLAVLVTSLELPVAVAGLPAADRCGSCTRCVDACPTGALLARAEPGSERTMDASRCISYLTIEKQGAIPAELREGMGRQVFGCDICQEVCPWNRRAPVAPSDRLPARSELVNPRLAELAALDGPAFNRRFRGSPLERTGRRRLHRNVAIAMGNTGDPAHLAQLDAWADGPAAANTPDDPVLREAAGWARTRILSGGEDSEG